MLASYFLHKEKMKCLYINNGNAPHSRPFFTLSMNDTGALLYLLHFLAENSDGKKLHEIVVDQSTGQPWLLVFQRVHSYEHCGQLLSRICYLMWFTLRKWLKLFVQSEKLNIEETLNDVTKWLLRIMSKEPQNMIDMSITYSIRQEQWRFLFLKLVD